MTKYGDVSGYDEKGFPPPVEPGNYIVKVDDIQDAGKDGTQLTDKNDEPYVWIVFKIKGQSGRTVRDAIYPNPSGPYENNRGGKLKQLLIALEAKTTGGDMAILLGKTCRALVSIREYTKTIDGKPKTYQVNNVDAYEPIENGAEREEGFPEEKKSDDDLPF